MVFLGDVAHGRDNNFNLIRAIAATAVLVSHAFPIALGPGTPEPLKELTGHTLGGLAVYAFFAISGFLITASFHRSSTWLSFLTARFLRLVPALVISLLFVAFILGPLVTSLSVGAYLTNIETYTFLIRNATLVFLQFELPGVFEANPYTSVEGSIWTLFHEVVCYMIVFFAGILGVFRSRLLVALAIAAYLALWFWIEVKGAPVARLGSFQDLSLAFVIGACFYVWREKLPLSWIAGVVLVGLAAVTRGLPVYDLMLNLALAYWVFLLAYLPGGVLRAYNRLGDYSYGIYIYAFPLQGWAVWMFGDQSPYMNMIIAFVPTVILSVLSWHMFEKPALAAKPKLVSMLAPVLRVSKVSSS